LAGTRSRRLCRTQCRNPGGVTRHPARRFLGEIALRILAGREHRLPPISETRNMGRQHPLAVALALVCCLDIAALPVPAAAQEETLPAYQRDRGPGVPSSMFGTYLQRGEVVVFPFFEYAKDHNLEYKPAEFGLGPASDFRGRFRSTSEQFFLGYGATDGLALELEAAYVSARLDKVAER